MADNVDITAGTGTTIATDQVGTDHYQKVKLVDGTADSTTAVLIGGGAEAGALRVTIANDSTGVLSIDDNGASITVDNAGLTELATAISGNEMQVDVVASLPAGTNAIGKLAANSGVDIGDVDVTSMPANTLVSETIDANGETVAITLPNGCAAVGLQITGMPGSSQLNFEATLDGTNWEPVEASNGLASVNATAGDDIFILPGAGYAQVRVRATAWGAGTATITFIASIGTAASILTGAIPAGTNAIGKLAANSGVDIGDVDVTSISAGTNLIGKVSSSHETSTIYNGTTALTPKYAAINVASSGDNTLVAAVASKKIRVMQAALISAGTVNVRFEDGAGGGAESGQMPLIANTGFVLPYSPMGWFETTANTLLNLELSAAVSVDGVLGYVEV